MHIGILCGLLYAHRHIIWLIQWLIICVGISYGLFYACYNDINDGGVM
jgi:hypothetical protein